MAHAIDFGIHSWIYVGPIKNHDPNFASVDESVKNHLLPVRLKEAFIQNSAPVSSS